MCVTEISVLYDICLFKYSKANDCIVDVIFKKISHLISQSKLDVNAKI